MRLHQQVAKQIPQLAKELFGNQVEVRVFGSRLDDAAKGGDLDLYIETSKELDRPAYLSSKLATKVSRLINGRKVDVVIKAPNLKELEIHRIAKQEGQLL